MVQVRFPRSKQLTGCAVRDPPGCRYGTGLRPNALGGSPARNTGPTRRLRVGCHNRSQKELDRCPEIPTSHTKLRPKHCCCRGLLVGQVALRPAGSLRSRVRIPWTTDRSLSDSLKAMQSLDCFRRHSCWHLADYVQNSRRPDGLR